MSQSAPEFQEVLDSLESALETPVVPGELVAWAGEAAAQAAAFQILLNKRLQVEHARDYERIDKDDPTLIARTEQLAREDEALKSDYDEFVTDIRALNEDVEGFEPDESAASERVEAMVQRGLDLVIRIRRQELAVKTWFSEAAVRDRGVKD